MNLGQELDDQLHIRGQRGLRSRDVKLDPVARTYNDRFTIVPSIQLRQGPSRQLVVEHQTFAQLYRRIAEAPADDQQFHRPPPCTVGCEEARVRTSRAKATMVSRARFRPRTYAPWRRYTKMANTSHRATVPKIFGSVQPCNWSGRWSIRTVPTST